MPEKRYFAGKFDMKINSPASEDEAPSGSHRSRPILEDVSVSSAAPVPYGEERQ
jgi:hypothetical protein